MSAGTEATEAAMKLMRMYGEKIKKNDPIWDPKIDSVVPRINLGTPKLIFGTPEN